MKIVMNFILKIFELLKSDPKTAIAKYLIGIGVILLGGIGSFTYIYEKHSFQYADEGNAIGYLFLIFGFVLLIHRYITIKNNAVTLAYGMGIENMDINAPIEAIPKYERFDCIEINLKKIDSYDKNSVLKDYDFNKTLISERMQNKNSKKVYVSALGSFPYLFLLGSLFRNAYSEVITLDFDRHKSKWYKLPAFSEKKENITHILMYEDIAIDEKINELNNLDIAEVGIALSYTFEVNKNAIPSNLQNHTLYLTHSYGVGHDKLSNEEAQESLLKELSLYMAILWNSHEKIHLFVSSQASMCINIGKIYMNNAHGILVLHNYDNASKSYNWSIEFNQGKVI
jgi:hypothetical protein